jgi:hypothetical protein
MFPPSAGGHSYGIAKGKTVDDVNTWTGGWNMNTTRLIWANGEFDPWRDATVSSEFRPGGPLESTPEHPNNLIPGGIHCSDLVTSNGKANAGVKKIQDNEVAVIKAWAKEFYTEKGLKMPKGPLTDGR